MLGSDTCTYLKTADAESKGIERCQNVFLYCTQHNIYHSHIYRVKKARKDKTFYHEKEILSSGLAAQHEVLRVADCICLTMASQ